MSFKNKPRKNPLKKAVLPRGNSKIEKFEEPEDFASNAFDRTNPYSLINMIPGNTSQGIKKALVNCSDLLHSSDFYDLKYMMEQNTNESEKKLVESLRLSFWHEQVMAQAEHREMVISRVYAAFCGRDKFKDLMNRPETAAYIFTRPPEDQIKLRRVLDKGYERLEEVLSLPLVKFNGNPDVSLIKEVREIVKMIDNRLNGGVIQKIHQTSLNVNHNNSSKQSKELTEEEIDKKLLELQNKMNPNSLVIEVDAGTKSEAIEVEATGVVAEESEA